MSKPTSSVNGLVTKLELGVTAIAVTIEVPIEEFHNAPLHLKQVVVAHAKVEELTK